MKKAILYLSALLLFLCVSSFGLAFDDQRRGFILGGIFGTGLVTWTEFRDDVEYNNGTDIAIHTGFRIGGGFKGDRVMLYYLYDFTFFNKEYNHSGNFDRQTIGFTGLGVSYYFKPTSPSLYINAGIGVSLWFKQFETYPIPYPGPGAMGGIGYEFARHWSVECGVMWGRISPGLEDRWNLLAFSLSIVGIAY
jgi:hypothetical protein